MRPDIIYEVERVIPAGASDYAAVSISVLALRALLAELRERDAIIAKNRAEIQFLSSHSLSGK